MLLVAEDRPSLRELLCLFLQSEGYHVRAARHGGEAIALLDEGEVPELLILDLQMPVCGGAEVVRHARASTALADVPILILTGSMAVPSELAAQVQGVMAKPFDLDELATRVRALAPAHAGQLA